MVTSVNSDLVMLLCDVTVLRSWLLMQPMDTYGVCTL